MKRSPVVRNALAIAVATMGVIDLWSALLSRPPDRILAIRHLVPTELLDTSRTFTLLAGALLLVTAWGLRKGKRRAFVAALLLCAVSVPVNLLKAFDFEEATVAAALMFLLGVSGDVFRVKSRELSFGAWRSRATLLGLGLAVYAIAGCWYVEARYGGGGSLRHAISEALYQLLGVGEPSLAVPRTHRVVRWFLDSISVLGFTTLLGVALASLQPARHRRRHREEADRVAELVQGYGDSSVSAFALGAEVDYFFSSNGRAVIAYRFEAGTLLVIGDAIGPPEEIPSLLAAFADHCREHDWEFAFYQARPEHLPDYHRLGWRAVHIGEDPVLWTQTFSLDRPEVASLRRTVRKLERDGLEARMFVPGQTPFDAAHDPEGLLDQMRTISAEWLRTRHGDEKGFCMGRFDPAHLRDVWLAVAWDPTRRRVQAFCTWVPVPARHGWALDLMRRHGDAVNGATEFLIAKSVESARARGDVLLSLSLSALAKVDDADSVGQPGEERAAQGADSGRPTVESAPGVAVAGPATLPRGAISDDRAREFLMERLARFYDFKSLFRWKRKFAPAFEDRYLVFSDPMALPRVAHALLRVQSPGGLRSYLRRVT
jgi:phosphatidylglycerol lysyltransferase